MLTGEARSVNHWTAREVPQKCVLNTEEGKFIASRYLIPSRLREPGKLFLHKRALKLCWLARCGGQDEREPTLACRMQGRSAVCLISVGGGGRERGVFLIAFGGGGQERGVFLISFGGGGQERGVFLISVGDGGGGVGSGRH